MHVRKVPVQKMIRGFDLVCGYNTYLRDNNNCIPVAMLALIKLIIFSHFLMAVIRV